MESDTEIQRFKVLHLSDEPPLVEWSSMEEHSPSVIAEQTENPTHLQPPLTIAAHHHPPRLPADAPSPTHHRVLTTTARHRPPITARTARAWDDSFLQRRGTLEDDAFLVWNGKQVMKEVAQ